MNTAIEPYYVVEDYLAPEQASKLLEYFLANEDYDPREFYGNLSLGAENEFFSEKQKRIFDFDPDQLLHAAVAFGKEFFLKNYKMKGTSFKLNRSHVNYMHTGAELASHNDDRRTDDPIEGLNSMTYVMGLFLNDDYEGGELCFNDLGVSLKPKPGTLILFPGFYTVHGVNKVTSGTRVNVLSHYFDVIDSEIPYEPDYAVAPPANSSLAV